MSDPIRISREDLRDPKIDEHLAREASLRGAWADDAEGGEAVGGRVQRRSSSSKGRGGEFYLHGVLGTALMGLLGSLAAWAVIEPYIHERSGHDGLLVVMPMACVAGAATLIALTDALLSRAWSRMATNGAIGLGVGVAGGAVFFIVASILFGVGSVFLVLMLKTLDPEAIRRIQLDPTNLPFSVLWGHMSVRAMAWSVFGIPMGLAPGLVQKSRDLIMVGVLGGVAGGFLGGVLFDPIGEMFSSGAISRAFGFGVLGMCSGLSIGLVEQLSKDAWLYMEKGPLAGKQFVLYKDPTRIGSSPKCDVYIFKDSEINPDHAHLLRVGGSHEIEARDGGSVLVNRKRVSRQRLEDGDEIQVGGAVFRYYVNTRRRRVG